MKIEINIPEYVNKIKKRLKYKGFECFVVGGALRDIILGLEVNDFDLATSCSTEKIKEIFNDYSLINNNGEKHNTITICTEENKVEITTYKHNDNETNSIKSDLMHRDITINSLAYDTCLVDYTGGYQDLIDEKIKACGNAEDRIVEDPLRILRALRFSAKLGFEIEEYTSKAIHNQKEKLKNISSERIKKELDEILSSKHIDKILIEYKDVIGVLIPELIPTFDFDQKNPYHMNSLYNHLVTVCLNISESDIMATEDIRLLRLAALLHDIGKTKCMTVDDDGIAHFYRHADIGKDIGIDILKRLKYSNDEISIVEYLIKNHDLIISPTYKSVKKHFAKTPNQDKKLFYMLLELISSDKKDHTKDNEFDIVKIKSIVEELINQKICLNLLDLNINGNDLIELGYHGKEIGLILNQILDMVIEEKITNERTKLLEFVRSLDRTIKT